MGTFINAAKRPVPCDRFELLSSALQALPRSFIKVSIGHNVKYSCEASHWGIQTNGG